MSIPSHHDVIAIGLNAVDVLVRLPETVLHDSKHFVKELLIQGGAPMGTGSSAVAMLGYSTAFVGRLGQNTLSEISIDQFKKCKVSVEYITRDNLSRPALALVEIDPKTAARTVFVNLDDYGFLKPEDIPVEAIRSAKVLMVDSYDLNATEAALRVAQGSDCRTMLDFESGDRERLRRLLAFGTDVILPLACARDLSGEDAPEAVLKALSVLTPGELLVTDGAHGSWAWNNGQVLHQKALPVACKIDSTGCGDAYHAGYVVGLLENWPLPQRMEFGSWLASQVIAKVGGRTALPTRRDLVSAPLDGLSAPLTQALKTLSVN